MASSRISENIWDYSQASGILEMILRNLRTDVFFCQLKAVETFIWLAESSGAERFGMKVPDDSGDFRRLCAKMATGSGKTIVMAMVAAWYILNKVVYPRHKRFSKNFLVIAPGPTVMNRLAVLQPTDKKNHCAAFSVSASVTS